MKSIPDKKIFHSAMQLALAQALEGIESHKHCKQHMNPRKHYESTSKIKSKAPL